MGSAAVNLMGKWVRSLMNRLNLHECLVSLQSILSSSAYDIAVFVATIHNVVVATIHNVVVSTSVVKEAVTC